MELNTVNVGEFNVVLALPDNSQLMAAWSARWKFGEARNQDGTYSTLFPVIKGNEFFASTNPVVDLAAPGAQPAIVVELKTVPISGRTSARVFASHKHHIVSTPEDKAWVLSSHDYWGVLQRSYGSKIASFDLSTVKSFPLTSLIGDEEFKKIVAQLKTKVRKL